MVEKRFTGKVAWCFTCVSLGSSDLGKNKYGSWGSGNWFPRTFCTIGKNLCTVGLKNKFKILLWLTGPVHLPIF